MSLKKVSNVVPLEQRFFLLEMHSERFIDLVHALKAHGFVISNTLHTNRFRLDDAEKSKESAK